MLIIEEISVKFAYFKNVCYTFALSTRIKTLAKGPESWQ